MTTKTTRRRDYQNHCWWPRCGGDIDSDFCPLCSECNRFYRCLKCGQCLCDRPGSENLKLPPDVRPRRQHARRSWDELPPWWWENANLSPSMQQDNGTKAVLKSKPSSSPNDSSRNDGSELASRLVTPASKPVCVCGHHADSHPEGRDFKCLYGALCSCAGYAPA